MTSKLVLTLLVSSFFSACSDDSDDATTPKVDLSGTWQTSCTEQPAQNNQPPQYAISEISDKTGTPRFTVTVYTDKDCKTKFISLGNESERKVGAPIEGLTDTYELDIDFKKLLATAHSDAAAGFLKQVGCGSGDFTVDAEKDVSATGCLFFAMISKCSKDFDIIKRVEDKLYNGVRAGDQCVVAGRPKTLNTFAFVKK